MKDTKGTTQKIKHFLKWSALTGLTTSWFVMCLTFVVAYSHPDKKVGVLINHYGEANIELIILIFFTVCIVLFLINTLRGGS
jgi:energy-coupling factor transporter transmembrane protein EcfT